MPWGIVFVISSSIIFNVMVYEYRYDMHVVQYLVMSCSSAWGSTTVVIRALMIHRECLVPVKIRPRSKKSRNPMLDISKSSRTQLEGNYWAIIETKCEQTLLRTEDRQATGKRSNLSQWKTALDPYCCRIVSQHHSKQQYQHLSQFNLFKYQWYSYTTYGCMYLVGIYISKGKSQK